MGYFRFKALMLILFPMLFLTSMSLATIFLPENTEIKAVIHRGDQLLEEGKPYEAWKLYWNHLIGPNTFSHSLLETEPGYYMNVREVLLKRMSQIFESPNVPTEVKIESGAYLKKLSGGDYFRESSEEERQQFIDKAALSLPSQGGFQLFDQLGSIYLEEGRCERAVSLWEEAKEISPGYKHLNEFEKALFTIKLGYCYVQLGWKDKVLELFKENPQLTKAEVAELLAGHEQVQETLAHLQKYSNQCPTNEVSENIPSGTPFTIDRRIKDEINENKDNVSLFTHKSYLQERFCMVQEERWCFEREKEIFRSDPLILQDRVYLVSANPRGEVSLLTLDKKTGKLLNQQNIETRIEDDFYIARFNYSYHPFLENGKICLTTEHAYHEFNLDGHMTYLIDLMNDKIPATVKEQYANKNPPTSSEIARSSPPGPVAFGGGIGKFQFQPFPQSSELINISVNEALKGLQEDLQKKLQREELLNSLRDLLKKTEEQDSNNNKSTQNKEFLRILDTLKNLENNRPQAEKK